MRLNKVALAVGVAVVTSMTIASASDERFVTDVERDRGELGEVRDFSETAESALSEIGSRDNAGGGDIDFGSGSQGPGDLFRGGGEVTISDEIADVRETADGAQDAASEAQHTANTADQVARGAMNEARGAMNEANSRISDVSLVSATSCSRGGKNNDSICIPSYSIDKTY